MTTPPLPQMLLVIQVLLDSCSFLLVNKMKDKEVHWHETCYSYGEVFWTAKCQFCDMPWLFGRWNMSQCPPSLCTGNAEMCLYCYLPSWITVGMPVSWLCHILGEPNTPPVPALQIRWSMAYPIEMLSPNLAGKILLVRSIRIPSKSLGKQPPPPQQII